MDTITHTLFGITTYKAINLEKATKEEKRAFLFTSLAGNQIPDIDVISRWWDQEGLYLMWHRGITHSLFLVPIWAVVLSLCCFWFWRVRNKKVFYIGLLSVFIHDTSDIFNAWGTGYFEPFTQMRLAFGTIPIIDFFVWMVILAGFLIQRIRKYSTPIVFKWVGAIVFFHFIIQSVQGYSIYHQVEQRYEQIALSASFVPWHFQVIGKKDGIVEIAKATVWSKPEVVDQLKTANEVGLDRLFQVNKKAKTLYQWAPFVVIIDEPDRYGIYDPRFYRNGQSFLFEYMEKH